MVEDRKKDRDPFSLALEHLLAQRGWGSVSTLAMDAKMSQSHVTRIRSGQVVGSFAVREKIAKALGTSLEEMISLGRRLQLGEGGERRSGQGRRASDLAAPQLIRLCAWLKSIPSAYRYLEMAELATTEGDLKLVLNLLKSAITKVDEVMVDGQQSSDPTYRKSSGGGY